MACHSFSTFGHHATQVTDLTPLPVDDFADVSVVDNQGSALVHGKRVRGRLDKTADLSPQHTQMVVTNARRDHSRHRVREKVPEAAKSRDEVFSFTPSLKCKT